MTGQVFPAHDMTHYAVETTFGYTEGFFGLVADGWDMSDWNAEDLLEQGRLYLASRGDRVSLPSLTDEMLAKLLAIRAEVFAKWNCIEPGGTLELLFQRDINRRVNH